MKVALIAITKHGIEHARALKSSLPESTLWVSEKQKALAPDADGYFPTIKEFTASAWNAYDGLVYFVSLGAVVRTIAPFLKSKDEDPAVLARKRPTCPKNTSGFSSPPSGCPWRRTSSGL
jgi:cobalt-precorrin 5A hydrolase